MHLTIPSSTSLVFSQIELLEKAVQYEQSSLAANTRRTYLVMWTKFVKWCQNHQLCPLPATAETISLFLSDLGGKVSFSTIDSVIASIEKTVVVQKIKRCCKMRFFTGTQDSKCLNLRLLYSNGNTFQKTLSFGQ